jgi:hypothetical protein
MAQCDHNTRLGPSGWFHAPHWAAATIADPLASDIGTASSPNVAQFHMFPEVYGIPTWCPFDPARGTAIEHANREIRIQNERNCGRSGHVGKAETTAGCGL